MSKGNYLTRKQYFAVGQSLQSMSRDNGALEGKSFGIVAAMIGKETGVPLTETNIRKVASELGIKWKGPSGVKANKPGTGVNSFTAQIFKRIETLDAKINRICDHLGIAEPVADSADASDKLLATPAEPAAV